MNTEFYNVLKAIDEYLFSNANANSDLTLPYPLNPIGQCEDSAEYLKKVLPMYINGQVESLRAVLGSPDKEERKRLRQKLGGDK